MSNVLATDLGIWPCPIDLSIEEQMLAKHSFRADLANYLLLYDQIVIPTGNFQILPVLQHILGANTLGRLLHTKEIVFVRFNEWFGYNQEDGIIQVSISDNPDSQNIQPNLATSYFKPLDVAIDTILAAHEPLSEFEQEGSLKNYLFDATIQIPTNTLLLQSREETYKDILGSEQLRGSLSLRNDGHYLEKFRQSYEKERAFNHMRKGGSYKITIFNPHVPIDSYDAWEEYGILRVAFDNYLLGMGGFAQTLDITGDNSSLSILQAKRQRLGFSVEKFGAFAEMQDISGIPDIGNAYAKGSISTQELLDLRYSKHCQAFRDWFAKGSPPESSKEIIRRFVDSIGKPSLVESLPMKLVRLAATTGLGALEPITGAIASAVDSVLLSSWFPGKSPRLFMKEAKVLLAKSSLLTHPMIRGRDRNKPCLCGSGKKFKNCCGVRNI
ncbi:MAG: SEC-C domain-containing protein [Candidatus Kapabacteria bacterium]|nr:SEC-C domain-containing protein [Candidatus Kapabacteria bacterium]